MCISTKYLFFNSRVGSDAFNALSQPMISRYVGKYTDIISRHLAPKFIKFPQSQAEIEETKFRFEIDFKVPGVLSIVDGTHVAISAMSKEIEHAYVNRKGFHSINAQISCDARMVITSVNARYPGSTHDSFIFLASRLYAFLKNLYEQDPQDLNIIIGTHFLQDLCIHISNNFNFFQKNLKVIMDILFYHFS